MNWNKIWISKKCQHKIFYMLNGMGMAKSCQIKIDCTGVFNELFILKLIKVETGTQHQILFL